MRFKSIAMAVIAASTTASFTTSAHHVTEQQRSLTPSLSESSNVQGAKGSTGALGQVGLAGEAFCHNNELEALSGRAFYEYIRDAESDSCLENIKSDYHYGNNVATKGNMLMVANYIRDEGASYDLLNTDSVTRVFEYLTNAYKWDHNHRSGVYQDDAELRAAVTDALHAVMDNPNFTTASAKTHMSLRPYFEVVWYAQTYQGMIAPITKYLNGFT
ncbi:M9 family metallopeptidase N-terminal domain-containing protein, partial [Thalassotalea ganghwensis]